jgi:hypothetical protein
VQARRFFACLDGDSDGAVRMRDYCVGYEVMHGRVVHGGVVAAASLACSLLLDGSDDSSVCAHRPRRRVCVRVPR